MTPRRARRAGLVVLLAAVAALVGAGPAAATPWGSSGADYTGVLCRLGAVSVPSGSWLVNGSVEAYATADIAGQGPLTQPAPVTGSGSDMVPGEAGFSQADIAAVAYLLDRHGAGSPAERAEISAEVAALAGGGGLQARCLGQGGTSAARAAARLAEARRFAGPYTVSVSAPSGGIPGDQVAVSVTVRSATGAGTPGIPVRVGVGADVTTATTGADGQARVRLTVPAAAATTVTAAAAAPTGLTYFETGPPSVAAAAPTTVRGTAALRPVLHPDPTVSVAAAELLLSGGRLTPVAQVGATSGYSGTGTISVYGPVATSGGAACSTLPADRFGNDRVAWRGEFTFRGDGPQRAGSTPDLDPGCYAVRASVTTTDSTPAETRAAPFDPARTVTVTAMELSSAATATVAPVGPLQAVVTASKVGRARLSTTVVARGPVAVTDRGCADADFDSAGSAATSDSVQAARTSTGLRASVRVTGVTRPGCYALDARNTVTLDGKTLVTSTPLGAAGTTTAVLRPRITVTASAPSGEQGTAMAGTVHVDGTYGFPGEVTVGLIRADTVPITGCADARFPSTPVETADARPVRTDGDAAYAVRTPATGRNACYAMTARLVLTDNKAVTARTSGRTDAQIFLAGLRPRQDRPSVVDAPTQHSGLRAVITYGVFGLLVLAGCVALFARTLRDELDEGMRPWTWRPNRLLPVARRPMPGPGTSGTG